MSARRYLPCILFVTLLVPAADVPVEEQIARHRNLGKAFYENPTTHLEAVAEFKKALDLSPNSAREQLNYGLALLQAGKIPEGMDELKAVQRKDPALPYTWFNLGIYYKKAGEEQQAIAQFERMVTLAPNDAIAHYQLGALYRRQAGRMTDAVAQLERAAQLDPQLAAARFQLFNVYRQLGRTEAAARALQVFQELKKQAEGSLTPEDVDWSPTYSEVYDPSPASAPEPAAKEPVYTERVLDKAVDSATAGLALIDSTGAGDTDLLVWSSRGIDLYRRGVDRVADSGLDAIRGTIFVAPGDFDNDGLTDLCVLTESGPQLYRNAKGKFVKYAAPLPQRRFERAVWMDYDHDYDLDLLLLGENPALLRNEGSAGFADRTADFPFVKGPVIAARKLRVAQDSKAFDLAVFYADHPPVLYRDQLGGHYLTSSYSAPRPDESTVHGDFDNDGRPDVARVTSDGKIHVGLNRSPSSSHWIRVRLQGVKSAILAEDAEVEIKAGTLYRKQTETGVPLLFDLGSYATVDAVRITWPNGLIQNEVNQAADRTYSYKELPHLSGSCPMIWTWNGRDMQFITDVLGVAPLGASDGDGSFFPTKHEEYVSIPAGALAAKDGEYDVRISEELSEVSYLDQAQLYAVDHPHGTEIFTSEKFTSPPYAAFRLYGVTQRIYPRAAVDEAGRDVLPRLIKKDEKYPDQFERTDSGIARPHTLELDFGKAAPSGKALLVLNGWLDWPDGSTFRAASQEYRGGLASPSLQMQDAQGRWKTVIEDMGMPSGKTKTIAVQLRFISPSRRIRIVTSLCIYWDEIFLGESLAAPPTRERAVPLRAADLHFRGYSTTEMHDDRSLADTYFYSPAQPVSYWNPTPGLYTRYGDVRDLVAAVDDRMVIMGSGDEMRLRFDATSLDPPQQGWTRDFILKVDGWAKDRDPNTAFSTRVEPLPFHGMSRYPYPSGEHYPDDPAHVQYQREYNTRPALRLIQPLADAAPTRRPSPSNDGQ